MIRFKNIFFAFALLPVLFLLNCSDDVGFSREQKQLRECTDNNASECRIAEPGVDFKKSFVIDEQEKKKADILFIVDTSGSMKYEQSHIRERFATFIESLKNVDWRVAISTAIIQPYAEFPGSGGTLIKFAQAPGSPQMLDANIPGAHYYFAQTIQRPKSCALVNNVDDCNDHERAIYQANLLILKNNKLKFFRPWRGCKYCHCIG
jgi:hypothetical protein